MVAGVDILLSDRGLGRGVTAEVDIDDLDISIAHWHVNAWGGAEYLVTKLAEALDVDVVHTIGEPDPDAPNPYGDISFVDVTPSLDYTPIRRLQQRAGRVFEYAQWEDVDWREFGDPDILVTSGATTRAVITPDDTLHINYCHSPPRWFYDLYHDRKSSITGSLSRSLVRYLRMRDASLDTRVDHYFVNSPIVERRLWKYYKRECEILYPPVELSDYRNEDNEGYYLHLGRLDEEKGVPAVIDAFINSEEYLIMAGGRGDVDKEVIDKIKYTENIEWLGFVEEQKKYELLSQCRAVVFNGKKEDFGIVPIEANASGKPVLARCEGFPQVFVEDGRNGILHDGTANGILSAVSRLESSGITDNLRELTDRFSLRHFHDQTHSSLTEHYEEFDVSLTK